MEHRLLNVSLVSGMEQLRFLFTTLNVGRKNAGLLFLASAFDSHYQNIKSNATKLIVKLSLVIETTQSPDRPVNLNSRIDL